MFWQVTDELEEQWVDNKVQGWDEDSPANGQFPTDHAVIDLDYYSSVEELMDVGPEKLKEVSNDCLKLSNSCSSNS